VIQSARKTYQANASTDGNLIVTHRLNKQRQWYNSRNKTTLETSEKFRKIITHDRASTLRNCTEINTIWQWIPYIDNTFTKEGCPHTWYRTLRFLYNLYWCPLEGRMLNSKNISDCTLQYQTVSNTLDRHTDASVLNSVIGDGAVYLGNSICRDLGAS